MWKCPSCQREFANAEQSHFCERFHTVDEYIAGCPAEVRPILQAIRQTIREAAPETVEKIAWRMPTFWDGENIVHFAAHKRHISLYPGGEATAAFANRLTKYKTSKGAVQFPQGMAIDHALIADIVRWQVEQAKNGTPAEAEPAAKPRYAMPDFIAATLEKAGLQARYDARPAYQRNGYIGWIIGAKREETRQKRLAQMLDELQAGDAYMGSVYAAHNAR